jgi:hypothetical protein
VTPLLEWLEMTPLALRIGESWWFPLLESLHVLTAMFVVGSILWVDLRLLGVAAKRYPVRGYMGELLRWTWFAFAIALLTGIGMFITRAQGYAANRAFQIKLVLLALAAVNMVLFHVWIQRDIERWNAASPSGAARFAGATSLALWIGITLAGRWTGHLI